MSVTLRWSEFAEQAPKLAQRGRERLFQFGPGLAFLATVRGDGGPRLHPLCVNIVDGGLFILVVNSPKRADLARDGRFALHCFPPADNDDEFYLTGQAVRIESPEAIARVEQAQRESGATTAGDEWLFELHIERALYSQYKTRGDPDYWPPVYFKWFADR